MAKFNTLKQLFKRYRRPGDFLFASSFLIMALCLVVLIPVETQWREGTKVSAQPALWPVISLVGMAVFASLHWISSLLSPKIPGRLAEAGYWARSLEFIVWFMLYVFIVPIIGYLLASILFSLLLALRVGYRSTKMLMISMLTAFAVVVLFKTFLQVKVPGGQIYQYLPDMLRSFMLTYF